MNKPVFLLSIESDRNLKLIESPPARVAFFKKLEIKIDKECVYNTNINVIYMLICSNCINKRVNYKLQS